MNYNILFTLFLTSVMSISSLAQSTNEVPFSKGVNLTEWFQAGSASQIDFSKFTFEDVKDIKSLGVDVIRLPINLHAMTKGAPNYELEPLFLFFLDEVVDWAEEIEIYLILDNHTFDPGTATDPNIGDILNPVWENMAKHYKDRSKYVLYEILNEPHGISNSTWSSIQGEVISTIRAVDTTHTIIVGASDYNSFRSLKFLPEYADSNLIYTFHFYDPFVVTHQGATWTNPSLANLSNIPFPYNATDMPEIPRELVGTWVEGAFNNYSNEGNAAWIKNALDIAIDFSETRGVPIFCGEFGVYIPNSDNQTRVNWYDIVANYLTEHQISWTIWDYRGGFGVYEQGGNDLFDHDLNIPLLEVLGFTVPDQTEFIIKADSNSFDIYSDFMEQGIRGASNVQNGTVGFYDTESVLDGEYSIYWSGSSQYEHVGFDFAPNKDLSLLVSEGYELVMYTRGLEAFSFDIRFIDTKTTVDGDRPWRMNVRIASNDLQWNGEWEEIRIPLSSFTEMGSWDENTWFNPQGDFDWKAVDVFQIVEESGSMGNAEIWMDAIGIVDSGETTVGNANIEKPIFAKLNQNFPNPFNPTTTISFELSEASTTTLTVYDTLGRLVSELVNTTLSAGNHSYNFEALGLSSGIYFYKLNTNTGTQVKKMLLLK